MFPQYVVHCIEGRVRLRHPALGEVAVRGAVQTALGMEGDVLDARPGAESMLLLLKPDADVAAICARLEQRVPVLTRLPAEVAAERRAAARARRCAQLRSNSGDKCAPTRAARAGGRGDKRNIMGISQRKLEIRAMLGVAGVCLAAGFAGPKRMHILAGLVWAAMVSRHVWVRRKAV